jgi:hypothetical protein
MNRIPLLAIGMLLLPAPAFGDYWFCEYSSTGEKQPTSYYSEIFGTADEHVGPRMNDGPMRIDDRSSMPSGLSGQPSGPSRREIGEAFAKFVSGDRVAPGVASCDSSPTRSSAERNLQRRKDKAAEKKRAVVQSDWVYSERERY